MHTLCIPSFQLGQKQVTNSSNSQAVTQNKMNNDMQNLKELNNRQIRKSLFFSSFLPLGRKAEGVLL